MFEHYAFTDKPFYGYEDPLFLTNFGKDRRPIYEQAIAEYHKQIGEQVLKITDNPEPYGSRAIIDKSCNALRFVNDRRDLSSFWRIFDAIKGS